jgi:hypothetical protein
MVDTKEFLGRESLSGVDAVVAGADDDHVGAGVRFRFVLPRQLFASVAEAPDAALTLRRAVLGYFSPFAPQGEPRA